MPARRGDRRREPLHAECEQMFFMRPGCIRIVNPTTPAWSKWVRPREGPRPRRWWRGQQRLRPRPPHGRTHNRRREQQPNDLLLSVCGENHVIAHADDYDGWRTTSSTCHAGQPDLIHAQNDGEVEALARFRTAIHTAGVKTFLPSLDSIEACRDKWASYQAWRDAGIPVPRTELVTNPDVLFRELADREPNAGCAPGRVLAGSGR
jgi:hypothetical protein